MQSCDEVAELYFYLIRRRHMSMSMKLMGAVVMSVGIGFAGGFAGGFTGAAWAAEGTADVPASVAEGKDFGCGAKGQKACPMQGWMKTVMQAATTSGDGAKIASALDYVASKPPPGMSKWVAISKEGAEKAKKGDIDGAKASCKTCHDLYKAEYKAKHRDATF
ncbi:MAG TPA: hypothetical protein VL242_18140 [Sorangium sp.]|uniref:hypothetical protein n=1 Tax=Sorangium sp. So ce1153 TaxID=3133333 RepID=UPI002BFE5B26|nr:hypothetical protein [Sorangium sp.]